jgi:hypothetical protein
LSRKSRNDSIATSETHQHFIRDPIVNANRFALTNLRPAAGRGAAARAGYPMDLAMNCHDSDCCKTNRHLSGAPASLWLEGYEDEMHPGEGSA